MQGTTLADTDEDLARRAWREGDSTCFAELFVRHRKRVFCACRGFLGDSHAAEDATQETFLKAYKNLELFRDGCFASWLMRIARNVCIDEWRRKGHEFGVDDLEAVENTGTRPPNSSFEAHLLAEQTWEEIKSLPREQRECLELKIEGFSYEETAEKTGLTVQSVKSHIQNGRRMLWQRITKPSGNVVRPTGKSRSVLWSL
jgi:RNA polymerase sigma-70 factor (ECF subfamily)